MSSWKQIQEPILFLYVTTKKKKNWAEIYDFSRGLHGDRRAKFDSVIIRLNTIHTLYDIESWCFRSWGMCHNLISFKAMLFWTRFCIPKWLSWNQIISHLCFWGLQNFLKVSCICIDITIEMDNKEENEDWVYRTPLMCLETRPKKPNRQQILIKNFLIILWPLLYCIFVKRLERKNMPSNEHCSCTCYGNFFKMLQY